MRPVSIPADPAQPNQLLYPFSALARVPLFTRASYKAAFGVDAPDWDATRPAQYWFDSGVDKSAAMANYTYQVVDVFGKFSSKTIPVSWAAEPNIPGLTTYPAYVVDRTVATDNGAEVNANTLSTLDQAHAMALALGLDPSAIVDLTFTNPIFNINYNGETRRMYAVVFKGTPKLVGYLLNAQYTAKLPSGAAAGVGHPGIWNVGGAEPVFQPAPDPPDGIHTGAPQPGTDVPPPVRSLLPNEKMITVSLAVEITRTDINNPAAPAAAGEGFTADDRAVLHQIYSALQKIGLTS